MTIGVNTTGLQVATPATMAPTMMEQVDTLNPGGSAPQLLAVPLGIISQANRVAAAVTAFAGGGQTSATQLDYGLSNVTVVATGNDSVKLPPCVAGAWCFLRNVTATSMTVYGYGTDTIDSVASATGNAQAGTKGKLYFGVVGTGTGVAGNWVSLLGA
jgi:hypothetical protein